MIVTPAGLRDLRGRTAMVDGGFDPLHPGHLAYFRAAAGLGAPVLCNVTADPWVARKHPVLLGQADRAALIDALQPIDYVHLAQGTTEAVLQELAPRYYVKGADWRDRLPPAELRACAEMDTEVVFLDTVIDSSTEIVRDYRRRLAAWTPPGGRPEQEGG